MSDIDFEAVAKQFQLENEILRDTVKNMAKGRAWKPDMSFIRGMSWEERYFAIAAVCSVIIALVSVVNLLRGEE